MNLEDDRRYTESYLWLRERGDKVEMGIVESAADTADRFFLFEMPGEGEKVEKGEPLVEYEAMKRVGDLESPIDGEVVEVNREVEEDPGMIIEDPWNSWLVRVEPPGGFDFMDLMGAEEAGEYYEEQV
ncbi:MAG: hypothetical protein MUP63_02725 [Candidatus Nanohaloarchaeota archaeon QJJ-7]|nr:hypothetical protein [Candidatus Nanohaloarchaeota archaeon QJJ-7]